jgi:UDP-3-O-[3-hydroxymyristoyl] glucosamine N-acyltransferase
VPDAYIAFATLLEKYQQLQQQQLTGIQQPVYIDATAKVGDQVYIGAFTYIGEKVLIGNGSKIILMYILVTAASLEKILLFNRG